MIVLDANILIRAVLGRRVRQLIDTYAAQGVRFYSPDLAFDDAEKYLPALLKKRGKPDGDVSASLDTYEELSNRLTLSFTASLKAKRANAYAAAMSATGPYWLQHFRYHARYGPRMRTFSERASQLGLQIAWRFF